MLQPVMISPLDVSSAAPTLKREYSASAPSRAARARSTRRSKSANDALQQRAELHAHAPRGFHHFVVMQRMRQHARGHVRDARDAQHFESHVARDNGFRYRRHADR